MTHTEHAELTRSDVWWHRWVANSFRGSMMTSGAQVRYMMESR